MLDILTTVQITDTTFDSNKAFRVSDTGGGALCIANTSALEKQRRFFVDNLMLGVQLADVLTRCSSHPQGKSALRMTRASSRNVGKLLATLKYLLTQRLGYAQHLRIHTVIVSAMCSVFVVDLN